jgi:hypothetical protein
VIVNGIILIVKTLLSALFSLLPNYAMPSWLSSVTSWPTGFASTLGGYLAAIKGWFPIDTVLTVLIWVLNMWPVIIGYVVFQWVWGHLPSIAGFSPGDGD